MTPILEFRDFSLRFDTFDGPYHALEKVSLTLAQGEALGVVGETGCGKSVTARSVLGLLPSPPARVTGGDLLFNGQSLMGLDERGWRGLRGLRIAMVFQDPMTYLNPVFTIGHQMESVLRAHERAAGSKHAGKQARHARIVELLRKVHLPRPEQLVGRYPHQLSGGQRQRVLIAMALSGSPELLIADEPTTALDVTIQAQILDLLDELRQELKLSILLISHDLGVISRVCDRVAVMYAGTVVEVAPVRQLFEDPRHPYTRGLLAAVPHPHRPLDNLQGIPGTVPNLLHPPQGCRFEARCPWASAQCRVPPPRRAVGEAHSVLCIDERAAAIGSWGNAGNAGSAAHAA